MRNKLLSIIACVIVALVTIIACDKKKDIVSHPAYSEFATPLVSNVKYFVRDLPDDQIKIPLGITTVSNVDRKIVIKDSSTTAVNGTQYTLSTTTITIPAGKTVDSLVLKGIYTGYPIDRIDTLYLKIVGGDVPSNAYNITYSVILQRYCNVIKEDLSGDFANAFDDETSGPYTATISDWTETGPTTATIKIKNLGMSHDWFDGAVAPDDPAVTGLTAKLDWTNPSNFTITIPSQPFGADVAGYGPGVVSGSGGFSSCKDFYEINWKVAVAAGTFSLSSVLKR
jgi:hypothetical protein